MYIFIDESGTFTGVYGKSNPSLVGALVIPEHKFSQVLKKYSKLRQSLPKNKKGEVKGSKLSEEQVSKVVEILSKNQAIFETALIDVGLHTADEIQKHLKGSAEGFTQNLTDQHYQDLKDVVYKLREELESMSPQLYIQSILNTQVIAKVLNHAITYHALRTPKELSKFSWIIDGKEKGKVSKWENWWTKVVSPWLEMISIENPTMFLKGANYSHIGGFINQVPKRLEQVFEDKPSDDFSAFPLKKVLTENFKFSSEIEPGLELVDILTNATRRALKGNLSQHGWENIPNLMINYKNKPRIGVFSIGSNNHTPSDMPYVRVLKHFVGRKTMPTPSMYNN